MTAAMSVEIVAIMPTIVTDMEGDEDLAGLCAYLLMSVCTVPLHVCNAPAMCALNIIL